MWNRITFVVRTKNEERWLGHCLQSIVDHTVDSEIIIVDNQSTDESLKLAKMFTDKILTISTEDYMPGRALNMGFAEASNPVVACISAHCQIKRLGDELQRSFDEEHLAVYGKQIPLYKGVRMKAEGTWEHFSQNRAKVENFFHNGYSFMKKEAWEMKQFDETLTGKEDKAWADEMEREFGLSTRYEPSITCYHHWTPGCATWRGLG